MTSCVFAQQNIHQRIKFGTTILDSLFQDTTIMFTSEWKYPWYMVQHTDGNWENTLGTAISEKDTAHLHYTARCVSDHQGEHLIHFVDAHAKGDTIELVFHGGSPAYASTYKAFIVGESFWCEFYPAYPGGAPDVHISVEFLDQKLILKELRRNLNEHLVGYIEMSFVQHVRLSHHETISQSYHLRGPFKTTLTNSRELLE